MPEVPDAWPNIARVLPEYSESEIIHTVESRPMLGRITRIAAKACQMHPRGSAVARPIIVHQARCVT